jgi:hypothetical protein
MSNVSDALRELAEPWSGGEKLKAVLVRVSRQCGLGYWRTRDLWYDRARRIEPFEVMAIEDALEKKREQAAANEFQQAKLLLAKLETQMATRPPNFYRPSLSDQPRLPLPAMGAARGGKDSSMD